MKEFNITLDYSEIEFLQTSLEVILNRQLNSIAEYNLWLKKNKEKLNKLKEKIEAGKNGFFSNPKDDFNKLLKEREQVERKLIKNKNINREARKIYLNIIDEKFKNEPSRIEKTKDLKKSCLKEDRKTPFQDFHREWEKTFF
jgi:hypothetical protein